MKKVALFSTYCDTIEKQEILLKNIRKVKELGLDVFVLTLFPLVKEIHDESDFVIYSKENPVQPIDRKCICSWRKFEDGSNIISYFYDYGYASLLQLKRLIDFSSVIEYDHYFTMIYDIIITDEVEKIISEGRNCSFFKNPKVNGNIGGILTAFSHENAKKFSSLITEDSYYRKGSEIAEEWMYRAHEIMGGTIENIPVADSIDLNSELIETDHSPFSDFSLFIIKEKRAGIFFYHPKGLSVIDIETNTLNTSIILGSNKFVHISDKPEEIEYLKIKYKGEEKDLTGIFNKIIKTELQNYSGDTHYV